MEKLAHSKYNQICQCPGGDLWYADLGIEGGTPLIYLPGFPASRLEGAFLEKAAEEKGFRLISLDRPGIGKSAPRKDRTIQDYARDITALADNMELTTFALAAFSGGAAYAYSLIEEIGSRITSCAVIAGIPSPDIAVARAKKGKGVLKLWQTFPALPRLAVKWFVGTPTPEKLKARWEEELSELGDKEQAFFKDEENKDILAAVYSDAFSQGSGGPADEFALYTSSWIVNYEILEREKIHLFHGEEDSNTPLDCAEGMKEKIKPASYTTFPGEGCYSLLLNQGPLILEELRA